MATTFHPFPRLPSEIRSQIWILASRPRLVHISITPTAMRPWKRTGDYDFASPTPPPALMHACRESRQCAPYQKSFFTILPNEEEEEEEEEEEAEARYIWVDFERDMICLEDDNVNRVSPHQADIRRLRVTIPTGDRGDLVFEVYGRSSHVLFEKFTALQELQLAMAEDFLAWGSTWPGRGYGACPRENIRYLDLHTGLLLTGPQLEMAYNWSWQHGGRVLDMETFDEDHEFMLANYTGLDLPGLAEID
ncbi:hypothetical protein TGAMA5MH_04475 [Trichoderma gamsii]|uniref:2EXR domain-containing protein n=1 Tax=Trichoderma gamsii TaxID=398673 RepID=A0A2K0TD98_9HYPO|nr:hypothetical protein TGAMA5MH_04475 [Trichoderma gamsii]